MKLSRMWNKTYLLKETFNYLFICDLNEHIHKPISSGYDISKVKTIGSGPSKKKAKIEKAAQD